MNANERQERAAGGSASFARSLTCPDAGVAALNCPLPRKNRKCSCVDLRFCFFFRKASDGKGTSPVSPPRSPPCPARTREHRARGHLPTWGSPRGLFTTLPSKRPRGRPPRLPPAAVLGPAPQGLGLAPRRAEGPGKENRRVPAGSSPRGSPKGSSPVCPALSSVRPQNPPGPRSCHGEEGPHGAPAPLQAAKTWAARS